MDGSGAPAEPDGAAPAPPAFYGFLPRMAETQPAGASQLIAVSPAGPALTRVATEGGARLT